MPKYRKKPVEIEAYAFAGGSTEPGWPAGWLSASHYFSDDGESVFILTLEGEMEGKKGDKIIRGVKGEFYPCKPDIFDATYDPVLGDNSWADKYYTNAEEEECDPIKL